MRSSFELPAKSGGLNPANEGLDYFATLTSPVPEPPSCSLGHRSSRPRRSVTPLYHRPINFSAVVHRKPLIGFRLCLRATRNRHRTPSAWMILCTPLGDRQRWQHGAASVTSCFASAFLSTACPRMASLWLEERPGALATVLFERERNVIAGDVRVLPAERRHVLKLVFLSHVWKQSRSKPCGS